MGAEEQRQAEAREWRAQHLTPGRCESTPLSDDEMRQLVLLLRRFCTTDLDQWELWKLGTGNDEVYMSISRAPFPDTPPKMYTDLGRWVDEDTAPAHG